MVGARCCSSCAAQAQRQTLGVLRSALLHRPARHGAGQGARGADRGQPGQAGAHHLPCWLVDARSTLCPQQAPRLQINYNNKNMLMGAMIIAGWDKKGGGQARTGTAATRALQRGSAGGSRGCTRRCTAAPSAARLSRSPGRSMALAAPSSGASWTRSTGACAAMRMALLDFCMRAAQADAAVADL